MKKLNNYFTILLLMGILSFIINIWQLPYLDDFNWWNSSWKEIGYAGRFTGNFLILLLSKTQNIYITSAFRSIILLVVAHFSVQIISNISHKNSLKEKISLLIAFIILFFAINIKTILMIWNWTPGVVNYLLPFALVLPIIAYFTQDNLTKRIYYFIPLAFLAMLCLENFSTTFIAFMSFQVIIEIIRKRKAVLKAVCILISSISGFIIMLINSDRFSSSPSNGYSRFTPPDGFIHEINGIFMQITTLQKLFILIILGFLILALITNLSRSISIKKLIYIFVLLFISIFSFAQLAVVAPGPRNIDRTSIVFLFILLMIGLWLFSQINLHIKIKNYISTFIIILIWIFPLKIYLDDMFRSHKELKNIENTKLLNTKTLEYPISRYSNYYIWNGRVLEEVPELRELYKKYYNLELDTNIIFSENY